jgi:hypothetical protein
MCFESNIQYIGQVANTLKFLPFLLKILPRYLKILIMINHWSTKIVRKRSFKIQIEKKKLSRVEIVPNSLNLN